MLAKTSMKKLIIKKKKMKENNNEVISDTILEVYGPERRLAPLPSRPRRSLILSSSVERRIRFSTASFSFFLFTYNKEKEKERKIILNKSIYVQ